MATRNDIVKQAQAWLGRKESNGTHKLIIDKYNELAKPLPRKYRVRYDDEWCATFISSVALVCGAGDIIPPECSCSKMIELLKTIGSWVETDSYTPKAGDLVFYDWEDKKNYASYDNTNRPNHVGIVEKVSGKTITVIEGNKSQKVARRTLKVNGRYIRGFGVPKYEEESFKVGDKVKLTSDATVYNSTKRFSAWVYLATLYVREVKGARIVVSTKKTGAVTGAVNAKHLIKR